MASHGELDRSSVEAFRADGHLLVRGLLSRREAEAGRRAAERVTEQLCAEAMAAGGPQADPVDGHDEPPPPPMEYLPVVSIWQKDETLRELVCSPRLASLAAQLLGVEGVRLYHDQLFVKPPGAPVTSWHQDQVFWPLDTTPVLEEGAVSMLRIWVTLTDLPADGASLRFITGSHATGPFGELRAGHPERVTSATVDGRELPVKDYGPLQAGDATIHAGYMVHGAGANNADDTRYGMAVAYLPDGARVAEPRTDVQEQSLDLWLSGRRPGEVVDAASNPLLWPVPDRSQPTGPLGLRPWRRSARRAVTA